MVTGDMDDNIMRKTAMKVRADLLALIERDAWNGGQHQQIADTNLVTTAEE
jgi:hypothetical protein